MEYTIKAIETKFQGFVFRSRLEAKWAVMFELLGWDWDYEPCDFDGWIPDFAIYGKRPIYVEVKPVVDFPEDVAHKLNRSGCKDPMLIVGQRCIVSPHPSHYEEIEVDYTYHVQSTRAYYQSFGWTTDHSCSNGFYNCDSCDWCDNSWDPFWGVAVLGRWKSSKGKVGFSHGFGAWFDRISGEYDKVPYGDLELTRDEIKQMWAQSQNIIRWTKTS